MNIENNFLSRLTEMNKKKGIVSDYDLLQMFDYLQHGGVDDDDDITKYYNKQKKYILDILGDIKYSKISYEFFDKNKVSVRYDDRLIFTAEYSLLGLHNHSKNVWYWAYSIPYTNKNIVQDSLKLKDYAETIKDNEEIYYLFSNSNYLINPAYLEIIIKISMYVTKAVWYMPITTDKNNTKYILIKKIISL
jgi:hypothetical protein